MLIDDLLDLSRIASGKVELDIQKVDLNQTLRYVCESCLSRIREKGIRLETESLDATALIAGDPGRLQQVLSNVLINAIKFTPEKGAIRVTSARREGESWKIEVQDSGVGISAETLPRIFDVFEQGGIRVTRQFGAIRCALQ